MRSPGKIAAATEQDKQAILIAIASWKTTTHPRPVERCAIYSTAVATALHYEQEFVEH